MTPPPLKTTPGSPALRGRRLPPREVVFALVGLALVLALGVICNADGVFFIRGIHADALWQNAAFGVLACGMTIVIISGGIDLSVGSVAALAGVVFADQLMKHEAGGARSCLAAIVAGGLCGLVNGSLVAFLRVQPFVATLAMMAFARGLAKWLAGGQVITKYPYPPVVELLNTRFPVLGLDLSLHVFVFLACVLLTLGFLRATTGGLYVYALGDNELAARFAGIPLRLLKVGVYTISGLSAGVAGILFAVLERQGNPDGAAGAELTAIAMVVVGGTALSGGRGGILLTVLGALTITYLRKILDINAVETHMQLMITGGIIVLAVLAQSLRRR